ncbi:TRAP transporter large permease [Azospirillum brasilense]|uniref:TRAP transporter large permease protein n=2 Tax=Pseudomonadota TaxID=1224 RepID=A0A0P0EG39_AZOBR|nr:MULTISPECIES: TRAP transporter large permease [Azospirillum]ALJ36855.1 C4-dicarboxylate ABC transporter [Azospirillum brasilense]MDW7555837.1 TRAP transporter large permease [Azospirillum brasilense]MDW7595914.1 TRAP transporter large permease [Azospirillum brasilense]MDW7630919.1 TRAP transporter large permease [Azospirillum brasilense]MDX5951525.1 TRAP transporter large permease [Azospirillum brasilense]
MSWPVIILIMLCLFALNMRLYIAIFASVLVYFVFFSPVPDQIAVQRLIGASQNLSLLAIPFFILLGTLMDHTGVAKRLLRVADLLVGKFTGGMALTNIMLSTLLGGVSASNLADSAMLTRMLVPEMERKGYNRAFAAAVTASGALVTPIIPPGIALIIYGLVADVSIGAMFMAGILPGIVMAAMLMVAAYIVSKRNGYPPSRDSWPTTSETTSALVGAWPVLVLLVAIIGGIRANIFTPTEAGAVAVLIVLVIGFVIYREMRVAHVVDALVGTFKATSSVMLVIMACSALAWILSLEQAAQQLATYITALTDNKYVFLLILNLLLLFLGMLIEGNAILIVMVPLLMPTVHQLGIDPIHFGIVVIVNLAVGCLTPPVGTVMLLVCNLAKVKISDFMKQSTLLFVALFVALMIVTFVPELSLVLAR